jgi:hypothetical protein
MAPNKAIKEFSCSEPGCDQHVLYEGRDPIPGLFEMMATSKETVVVYLTCPKGHTHPYTVEG